MDADRRSQWIQGCTIQKANMIVTNDHAHLSDHAALDHRLPQPHVSAAGSPEVTTM
jgi:hypothetical protein